MQDSAYLEMSRHLRDGAMQILQRVIFPLIDGVVKRRGLGEHDRLRLAGHSEFI